MPRAWLVLRASRDPNRRVFRRSQILALGTALLAHLPAGFISATASCARAEELRRTHFDLVFPVALLIPAGLHGPRPDGSVPASSRRTAQPFDFSEISLFPLRASASRAAFQGIALQTAHALCARNSFKYIAQITSVQALLALRPGALIHFPCVFPRAEPHQKAFGPPPLPGRWPSDPYRPVTGLRNAPFGAVLAGFASVLRSLITAGRSPLCSANGARLEQPG